MTRTRCATILLLAAAGCDDAPAPEPSEWRVVETEAAEGVYVQQATGSGEHIWAMGRAQDDPSPILLHFDGQSWVRVALPIGEEDGHLFAAAPDDLWKTGASLRRSSDGVSWTTVDLAAELGVPGIEAGRWIWGSGPDDVWTTDRTLRFDGTAWSEVVAWRDVTNDDDEWMTDLGKGCSGDASTMWILATVHGLGIWPTMLRRDGTTWSLVGSELGEDATVETIACRGADAWIVGEEASQQQLLVHVGSASMEVVEVRGDLERDALVLAAGNDHAWLVGWEIEDGGALRHQIWRVDGDVATPTVHGELAGLGTARAAWTADSGRTFVLGDDGLILEHL